LCITIAANIAESAFLAVEGCFPDSVVGFNANSQIADARFVKYSLDTMKTRMQSISRGTTQDNLSVEKLLSFRIDTPPLTVQRRIADILSAYDDLIDVNTRRIAILEEMARRIFDEWFCCDDKGKSRHGWQKTLLAKIADVNSDTISPRDAPDLIHYIDISSVSPGSVNEIRTLNFADAPGRARRRVKQGDVIWSMVRPNRRSHALLLKVEHNTVASTGFAVLRAKAVPWSFLYLATTTEDFVAFLEGRTRGSAYPAVSASDFEAAELLVPPNELLDRFHCQAGPMLELAATLRLQAASLRTARDLLLPKLISGEIDVSQAEAKLEAAQ